MLIYFLLVWTGFTRRENRGNLEATNPYHGSNVDVRVNY